MSRLPEKFKESIKKKLGDRFPAFEASLREPSPVSIRFNPFKVHRKPASGAGVPWCEYGEFLPSRPVFTLDPLLHAGSFYVQEASSMFLEQALKQCTPLNEPLKVLDLSAAPGGKSTHMLSLLHPESLLVSNEVIRSRATILAENVQKWGHPNAIVTNNDPKDFQNLKGFFDVIVVDAPCSGEGLFRKDPDAMNEWSPENVLLCASRQKRIIADVWDALKENGILIYCTCTYNESENEDNLKWLHENYSVECIKLTTDPAWGVEEVAFNEVCGYRFYPHQSKGEGFFISVIRKRGETATARLKNKKNLNTPSKIIQDKLMGWVTAPVLVTFFQFNDLLFFTPSATTREVEFLLQYLKIMYAGTNLATLKHDKLIPDQAAALSIHLNKESFKTVDLSYDEAIQYLRKDVIHLGDAPVGFTLLTFENIPLGWVNVLSNRVNNMYPSEWRIRMAGKRPVS